MTLLPPHFQKNNKKKSVWAAWAKPSNVIAILAVIVAIISLLTGYYANIGASQANEQTSRTQAQLNEILNGTLALQNKQLNYTLQVIPYPYYAYMDGTYVNGSTLPAFTRGFLNATFIISSPDIVRLTIENMSIRKINEVIPNFKIAENGEIVPDSTVLPEFDHAKFNQWSIVFETNSPFRYSHYPTYDNNFTYYTNHEGISTFTVRLPIEATFYLNPQHKFETDSQNTTIVDLGTVTVYAQAFDMQTSQLKTLVFSTELLTWIRIDTHT